MGRLTLLEGDSDTPRIAPNKTTITTATDGPTYRRININTTTHIPNLSKADQAMIDKCRRIYQTSQGLVPFSPVQFVDDHYAAYETEWIEADFDILRCPDWWDMPF